MLPCPAVTAMKWSYGEVYIVPTSGHMLSQEQKLLLHFQFPNLPVFSLANSMAVTYKEVKFEKYHY
jgi:hypothetical protein